MDNWYSRVKDEIKKQQEDPVWMSEDKVTVIFQFFSSIFLISWRSILFFSLAANSVICLALWTIFVSFVIDIIPPYLA